MNQTTDVKQQVRQFYDQVGWQLTGEQIYQNARYEDLRPVSAEYIHRCHLRPARHLPPNGRFLLDAGSGPIQYPEYLEYSRGYSRRVCADISITALQEARQRIGDHGLFVVADVANLPFKPGAFDGLVSLHTVHHLPEDEHLRAYQEFYRVLTPAGSAAVVNGWPSSPLMDRFEPLIRLANRARHAFSRLSSALRRDSQPNNSQPAELGSSQPAKKKRARQAQDKANLDNAPKGTFTNRHDVDWMHSEVGSRMPIEILVWRSVSVRFLRSLIHPWLGGRLWLKLLYWLEERRPHTFGANGQYPLIVIRKGKEK